MVKLGTYAAASAAGAAAVVLHAFHSRVQLYPAMLYLSTSKISMVLLFNMAVVLLCVAWQTIKLIFLGRLCEAEVERLNEQSWCELMGILFAITIFREEFNVPFVAMVTILLFIKAFHWLAQNRVELIQTTPNTSATSSRLSHLRMVSFLTLLLVIDSAFLYNSIASFLGTGRPLVALLFAFESFEARSTLHRRRYEVLNLSTFNKELLVKRPPTRKEEKFAFKHSPYELYEKIEQEGESVDWDALS